MSEQQIQAIIVRSLKTFIQAFLAVFLAGVVSIITNITNVGFSAGKSALLALVSGALAAGISAVMNAFIKPVEAK